MDLKRAKVEHTIHHPGGISSVAYSPDGKQIAGGGVNGRIWIADAATGQENMVLEHPWAIAALVFSLDGRRLFASNAKGPKESKVWDLAAPPATFVLEANAQQGWTLAFSPYGKHLVTSFGQRLLRNTTTASVAAKESQALANSRNKRGRRLLERNPVLWLSRTKLGMEPA